MSMLSKNIIHILNDGMVDNVSTETHLLACLVINDIVVDNSIFSKEFFDMFNNSNISLLQDLENGDMLILFINKVSNERQEIIFDERMGSIIVSGSVLVEVPENDRWVTIGSKYIDGVFYP